MKTRGCNKATHLCPCGYHGDQKEPCRCSPDIIARYQSRVSGPLLDRVDIHIGVQRIDYSLLRSDAKKGEASAPIRARVSDVYNLQMQRAGKVNARLVPDEVDKYCQLNEVQHSWLGRALDKFNLSARAIHRTLKVARTIADMQGAQDIGNDHLREALSYRSTLREVI